MLNYIEEGNTIKVQFTTEINPYSLKFEKPFGEITNEVPQLFKTWVVHYPPGKSLISWLSR